VRTVLLIGIGAGDPEYVTVQAIAALNRADAIFVLEKAGEEADLIALRREIVARYVEGDPPRFVAAADPPRARGATPEAQREAVATWRARRAEVCAGLIEALDPHEVGAFLLWGDPALYDGMIDVLGAISSVEFTIEVVPGIDAPSALCARHRIPMNRPGGAVLITTGRRLRDDGIPDGIDDVVVMLDPDLAFRGAPDEFDIYWGAYVGTPDELLVAGPVRAVEEEIARVRSEARARKGWMFDTYLLRRRAH
jgi:precorrin-6A synthase